MRKNIDAYFEKQKTPQKEIALKLRSIIKKTLPESDEVMKWGVPAYAKGLFYVVVLKDHVNLGFSIKNLTQKEQRFLQGSGKTMKHLEFAQISDIDEVKINTLVKLVLEREKE